MHTSVGLSLRLNRKEISGFSISLMKILNFEERLKKYFKARKQARVKKEREKNKEQSQQKRTLKKTENERSFRIYFQE